MAKSAQCHIFLFSCVSSYITYNRRGLKTQKTEARTRSKLLVIQWNMSITMPQTMWPSFSIQFFNALSDGVLGFVLHLNSLLLIGCRFSSANRMIQMISFQWQHREQNGAHHLKEHWKWDGNQYNIVCGILFDWIYCMTRSESKHQVKVYTLQIFVSGQSWHG